MMSDEGRERWLSLRARSHELLDRQPPEPRPPQIFLRPDALEEWSRGMPEAEPAPEPEPECTNVHAEIAAAVEAAISVEREHVIEVVATALAESLREVRRESADGLAAEVKKL